MDHAASPLHINFFFLTHRYQEIPSHYIHPTFRKPLNPMNQILENPPKRHPNLLLHCGAEHVSMKEVESVKTPTSTETWCPIPHKDLIDQVTKTLKATQLKIGSVSHSLSHEGQRYFGLMEVQTRDQHSDDYAWVLGLRNSHDKTFPAGLVAGSQVLICDNLAFYGDVTLARKHTRFITRDLPLLVERGIGQLLEKFHHQDKRIEAYKSSFIEDSDAHDLIIRSVDVGVCSNRLIPSVLHEWREPKHDVFSERNVWSLFNAFTESLKDGNLQELPKRTVALHGLLDVHVRLN